MLKLVLEALAMYYTTILLSASTLIFCSEERKADERPIPLISYLLFFVLGWMHKSIQCYLIKQFAVQFYSLLAIVLSYSTLFDYFSKIAVKQIFCSQERKADERPIALISYLLLFFVLGWMHKSIQCYLIKQFEVHTILQSAYYSAVNAE